MTLSADAQKTVLFTKLLVSLSAGGMHAPLPTQVLIAIDKNIFESRLI
jgi:hypothetical protein